MRGIQNQRKTQRQQPLVFFFTTRGDGYTMEATTSLTHSLSLSLLHAMYNQLYNYNNNVIENMCPESYLYIYEFSAYLHLCPSNRSEPIGAGSLHLPSGGTCFPTNSPFTPAWYIVPIRSASSLSGVSTLVSMSAPFSVVWIFVSTNSRSSTLSRIQ